jgi:hypothetical protein
MASYNVGKSLWKFTRAMFQLAGLIILSIGTFIVLILSGLFIGALFIRNFIRKKFYKK